MIEWYRSTLSSWYFRLLILSVMRVSKCLTASVGLSVSPFQFCWLCFMSSKVLLLRVSILEAPFSWAHFQAVPFQWLPLSWLVKTWLVLAVLVFYINRILQPVLLFQASFVKHKLWDILGYIYLHYYIVFLKCFFKWNI